MELVRSCFRVLTRAGFFLAVAIADGFFSPALQANPKGGSVVAGQAQISAAGNTVHIHQSSDRAVINWRDFSIQSGESTQFHQPSASSAVLNRVTSTLPSQILGNLQANGQVYLMNPNGIFFGPGAVVNASSFLAATADLAPEEFMAGRFGSLAVSEAGTLRNEGSIRAEDGSVQLLSRAIENSGSLAAPKGEVGLYAGRKFYLEPDGGGPIRVQLDLEAGGSERRGTGIDQRGSIRAAQARLEANGSIYALAIQQSGIVEATGFTARPDGTVVLSAPGGNLRQSGTLTARDASGRGGEVVLRAERVETDLASIQTAAGLTGGGEIRVEAGDTAWVKGRLEVSSASGRGGRLVVTGRRVGFLEGTMDASGGTGGGEILLGGDYLGANPGVRNAEATVLGEGARILADATATGAGGKIILWSEGYTGFFGEVFARGGPVSGDGGFIETSSRNNLQAFGWAEVSAPRGAAGLWLLDPASITISAATVNGSFSGGNPDIFTPTAEPATVNAATIVAALNSGTSVEITTGTTGTGAGEITVQNAIVTAGGPANATLTLRAATDITVNAAINLASVAGNVQLLADADASGTGTVTLAAAVTAGATGTVTLQGAGRINVGATVTAQNVVFQPSTVAASMGVVDPAGTVQVLLSDLQNVSATGTVTVGRANGSGTIRIGGTANLDLSTEGYGLTVLTGSSGQARLNGNITTAGRPITFDSSVILTGNRILKTNQGVPAGAAISLNGALDSDGLSGPTGLFWDFTAEAGTTGDVTFGQAVGVGARLGNILVGPANDLNIVGALRAESLATSGTLTGDIELTGSLDFSNHGIAAATVELDLAATGTITMNPGADVTSGGPITLEGGGGITTGADLFATGANITIRSPVTMSGPVAVTVQGATTAGGLPPEIRFESTVVRLTGTTPPNLTLDAGSFGDVVFVGGVGGAAGNESLGIIRVVSANNLTMAAVRAFSFLQSAGYGQTTFNGPQVYGNPGGLVVTTEGNIAVAAASITTGAGGPVTLDAGGRIEIGSGGDINADGAVTFTADGGITTGGDILTSGDAVDFKSAVVLASNVLIDTRNVASTGNITFRSTVDGPYRLQLFSGTSPQQGIVEFVGKVGTSNGLADLDVTANTIRLTATDYTIDETSGGTQTVTFDGGVVLGSNVVFELTSPGGDNALAFLGTVNSDGTARSLQITSGGLRFDKAVGASSALKDFFVIQGGPWSSTGTVALTAATVRITPAVEVTAPTVGLSISATGAVNLRGNLGTLATPLASVSISGQSVTFGGTEIRTSGNLTLNNGIITTPTAAGPGGNLTLSAVTGDILVTGLIDTRGTSGQASGNLSLVAGGNLSFADINTSAGSSQSAGTISLDAGNSQTITLNGTITATAGVNGAGLTFNDDVLAAGSVSLLTSGGTGTSGNILFAESLGGGGSLTINSGRGDVTFSGPVSGLGVLTITGGDEVTMNSAFAGSALNVTITGDLLTSGTVSTTGGILISAAQDVTFQGTVSAASFSSTLSGSLTLNGAVTVTGAGAILLAADEMAINAAVASGSGSITLRPFTVGLGMSISDPSAAGLVLSPAETGRLQTEGQVIFGTSTGGLLELAGSPDTSFAYDTRFLSGAGIHVNGDIDSRDHSLEWATAVILQPSLSIRAGRLVSGDSMTLEAGGGVSLEADVFEAAGNVAMGSDLIVNADYFLYQGTSFTGRGQTLTLLAPEILITPLAGSSVTIQPDILFSGNSTLVSSAGRLAFAGNLASSTGTDQVVLSAGTGGDLGFGGGVGPGAGSFASLLVQGNRIQIDPGAFLRAGSVTVDAGVFDNLAGSGALVSIAGRTLLFSSNPNSNSPNSFNAGIAGLQPMFNQPAQIRLGDAPGTFSIGNSLPGGSLALYGAQLANVLSPAERNQFAEQQAFLAAVPVTSYQLPRPLESRLVIRDNEQGVVGSLRVQDSSPSPELEFGKKSQPTTRPLQVDVRSGSAPLSLTPSHDKSGIWATGSYSQYSQSLNFSGE